MGFGKRFSASLCALIVFTQSARADMPVDQERELATETKEQAADPHVVTVPGQTEKAGHPVEEKIPLRVTPLSEMDPNRVLPPIDGKEAERVLLAYIRTRINEVKADTTKSSKDKKMIIEVLEDLMRAGTTVFKTTNGYSTVVNGLYLCGGVEVPLTALLIFQQVKVIKPSFSVSPVCVFLAGEEKSGSHGASGFVLGVGGWAGAQITKNTDADRAAGRNGDIEFQASGGVLVPLNGRAPNLRVGDLQGWYAGGGVELATPTFHRDRTGFISGSLTFLAKFDGAHFPDSGLIHIVVGRTGTKPFPFKGEALYFATYAATDGSTFRMPTIPFTDQSIGDKIPFTDVKIPDSAKSQHAPDNRIKELTTNEIMELVQKAQEELKKK